MWWIPNAFTLLNLVNGVIALMFVSKGQYQYAAFMIILSMIMDGLDGRMARRLHVSSEFGKQLDSLADLVSFGVAPAIIMYKVNLYQFGLAGWVFLAMFPICGALRLARFNTQQVSGFFVGLPITAAGTILATFILYGEQLNSPVFPVAMVVLSYLMVSTVPYPNFKTLRPTRIKFVPVFILAVVIGLIIITNPKTIILMPLVLYALHGLQKHVRKSLKKLFKEDMA